ncbi:RNA polymerase sigma factor SigW [Vulcanibacillus modesticaldus]|uniref:RNA polymerase sigma factor SigW n=1 Tax=Vulcanibacillus modesticaldus TaxID=337097 RepID=A0A1D2YX38_9BACI|nr:RNA polymerase sigma factor SigW [Vulcanibacillus modesticaldus]OEG00230.1 RNA polymerase sigma factor SigW [Vulcanibacillus modesticaldus]
MNFVDNKLIRKAKAGDMQAFAELVYQYKDKIFNLAYRMLGNTQEAEDVSQETFLRVYSNIDRYDEKYKFSTWIYKIATNLSIDRIRKRRTTYSLDDYWNEEEGLDWYTRLPNQSIGPEESIISNEEINQVHKAILNLPEKYRVIMTLRYVEDLSIKEISEIVNLPISTVKTRLLRGREYIRKEISNKYTTVDRSGKYEMS